jgi:hypothetical protein
MSHDEHRRRQEEIPERVWAGRGQPVQERLIETVAHLGGYAPAELRVELRTPLEHQSNRLYDAWAGGRHLLVKEYLKPEEFSTAPLHEHRSLELLAPFDVAPQPVGVELEHAPEVGPIVVYEYLDGEMWDRRKPSAARLAALADVWLTVHSVPTDQLWEARGIRSVAQRYGRFRQSFRELQTWTEATYPAGTAGVALCLDVLGRRAPVVEELDTLLERRPVRRYFCRSDARFANVIDRPDGRLGLVDWEDSGLRDPAREVSDLMFAANQEDLLSSDDWPAFLTPYLSVQAPGDPLLRRRIHLYAAIYPLCWLALLFEIGLERARNGTLSSWTVNGLPADVRLRRYLARALAWPDPDFRSQLAELGDLRLFPY